MFIMLIFPAFLGIITSFLKNRILMYIVFVWSLPYGLYFSVVSIPSLHLDLYQVNIPQIDADVFSGWGKLSSGTHFNQLSTEEKTKVSRLGELVDQFVAADKYVFVNPMWNFSFPPVMKAYIDSICVAGKTFNKIISIGRFSKQGFLNKRKHH
ncbi:Flavodoxin-like fold [Paenibacillus sp. yr247]|nr:Flavodoxin-like fold [Paenibacillus sp. yr247]